MPTEPRPDDSSRMPHKIEEARARPDAELWQAAQTELDAAQSNKVWHLVELPAGATAVGCRMLFDIKQPSGRCKCRLVAHGFSQIHGLDYNEAYSLWGRCGYFGQCVPDLGCLSDSWMCPWRSSTRQWRSAYA